MNPQAWVMPMIGRQNRLVELMFMVQPTWSIPQSARAVGYKFFVPTVL